MIGLTGASGQIGGEILKALLKKKEQPICADFVPLPEKFSYLSLRDPYDFLDLLASIPEAFDAVIHQGAISATTENDKAKLQSLNVEYTIRLIEICKEHEIPLILASSASVYGNSECFSEEPENENPLNDYAKSKLAIDKFIRKVLPRMKSQLVSLRYFNVYGGNESKKVGQQSPFYRFCTSLWNDNKAEIICGDDGSGIKSENHRRDFVCVSDIVSVNFWMLKNPQVSGIFNVGTGSATSFAEVLESCVDVWKYLNKQLPPPKIEKLAFPEHLKGKCQQFTEADVAKLRAVGYRAPFVSPRTGAKKCFTEWIHDE